MVLTLAVYLYYLVYRLLYTINHDALTFSVVFYYAELHGFISLALYFFQLWRPIHRTPSPALRVSRSTSLSPPTKKISAC